MYIKKISNKELNITAQKTYKKNKVNLKVAKGRKKIKIRAEINEI